MLLKRTDKLGNKFYINAFTGRKVEIKYVSPLKKKSFNPSSKDAKLIERLKEEVVYYRKMYKRRLAFYSARIQQ